MPRNAVFDELQHYQQLTATGETALGLEEKFRLLQALRAQSPEMSGRMDRFLLADADRLRQGLLAAQENQEKLKALLEELTAPPWHPAVFVRRVATLLGPRYVVWHGGRTRLVTLAEGLTADDLRTGDEVFLNDQLNLILCKSPRGMPAVGETAFFERYTEDGRVVIKQRDEELVVEPSAALGAIELKKGDQVRWDKSAWMAFEPIEREDGRQHILDEAPNVTPDKVGGQRGNLKTLLAVLTRTLIAPDLARDYGLKARQTVMMAGPPGTGKTLMARVAAAEISRLSGKTCKFAVVKPGEWENEYVGVTQRNIRNAFDALQRAAADGFGVMFLDEIEAVGRIRGQSIGTHSDKFLAALLAEIDGFADRENVAIVAATNRKDLISPALLERLSDVEIHVARPDMQGAREIFAIHLEDSLPFSPNGKLAGDTRRDLIEAAVSRIYGPNADNALCTLRFRDGKTRVVTARELA
ncbi:MAG: AAA family ATPase, partial [Planctomycetaceae bacterium]